MLKLACERQVRDLKRAADPRWGFVFSDAHAIAVCQFAETLPHVEGEWASRQWTRGCYNANTGPCGLIHFGEALNKPIGPIKWAATETANAWSGYMEGAVEAGRRAAIEALADL